ncbi:MAG: hypothetical protein AVDCRST_MAG77-4580 [uncultured Chloroflexi bacterium]|uniref:Uncharacterized protein n=1 Tax=uncultured Chloroflexota bacterium TaxID=166587 RepID=A0A6J4JWL8_9CHLR|nr:MAG: hypothetical protein AVDCRST_MAG77-4580 [uncultured Chloroflexota bacterium]
MPYTVTTVGADLRNGDGNVTITRVAMTPTRIRPHASVIEHALAQRWKT